MLLVSKLSSIWSFRDQGSCYLVESPSLSASDPIAGALVYNREPGEERIKDHVINFYEPGLQMCLSLSLTFRWLGFSHVIIQLQKRLGNIVYVSRK